MALELVESSRRVCGSKLRGRTGDLLMVMACSLVVLIAIESGMVVWALAPFLIFISGVKFPVLGLGRKP